MRNAALVLVLLCATASAQQWSAESGWGSPGDDPNKIVRDMHEQHDRRVVEMDRDFKRDSFWIFFAFGAFVVFAIGVKIVTGSRRERRRSEWTPPVEYEPVIQASAGSVDVTALRIGIDGRASKFVRTELEAIAKTYADNTPETRARKLREVSVMLRRVRDSWIYGGADNEPMRPPEEAFAMFAKHVDDARTRMREGNHSVTSPQAPPVSLILVSVIVVARGELMTVTHAATGEDLRRALESAAHRAADEILALEVVWVPDSEAQQVSSIDLESVYRRSELHPLQGAVVGKVFCTYCNGPFPAELVSCPHCGGPAPGRERQGSRSSP